MKLKDLSEVIIFDTDVVLKFKSQKEDLYNGKYGEIPSDILNEEIFLISAFQKYVLTIVLKG